MKCIPPSMLGILLFGTLACKPPVQQQDAGIASAPRDASLPKYCQLKADTNFIPLASCRQTWRQKLTGTPCKSLNFVDYNYLYVKDITKEGNMYVGTADGVSIDSPPYTSEYSCIRSGWKLKFKPSDCVPRDKTWRELSEKGFCESFDMKNLCKELPTAGCRL